MTRIFAVILLTLASAMSAFADNAPLLARPQAWTPSGGEAIEFDVLRNGTDFGSHSVRFELDGEGRFKVVNDINLKVKVAFIVAYRYAHDSTEYWEDGRLVSLEGETRKEGNDFEVVAQTGDEGLNVQGTLFNGVLTDPIYPSSHWNLNQLFNDKILSSESGELLPVETELIGVETLNISGVEVQATRFRMKSTLDVDLWYDDQGRWVKCAFSTRGQNIEYKLKALY